MYEVIHHWLGSSRDYDIGLELLRRFGNSDFLLKMLSTGKDYWNEKTLSEELTKLRDSVQSFEKEEKFVKAKEIVTESLKRPSDAENAPIEIKEIVAKRKVIYNEGKKLHARLKLYTDDEERYRACMRILEIRQELKKMWSFTNFYDDNLRLPENVQVETLKWEGLDDFSLNQQWHTNYKYVNKFMTDKTKTDKLKERITAAFTIKEILIDRNAFQFPNLVIASI